MDATRNRRADTAAARRAALPRITYPESLPVSARRDDIATAIRDHQVVVIAGETGSGKTTQIPKICLDLGRGIDGMIGHTQPRRIAARSVAERIADELGVELGGAIGYTVRFTDEVSEATSVKLMTDGILLAEIQRDRLLRRYDTIIIDEAHERSLNIDFLLGYLHTLLPRRPDLKVIITSATIDPERFARHFRAATGAEVPVIEVSGRTFPVEVRYRPLVDDTGDRTVDIDPLDGLCDAVAELLRAGDGDVLVFLSGEREIRDAADALAGRKPQSTEILPLYGRLSAADQHKVFASHAGRRVVLSTNVAETSLTVPGIRYVVDTGYARISRYSPRTKVQRLPIEPISRASADQRAGRCGRVADGICIRLYAEDDYAGRPEFTEPEILRTNLSSVILQMAALGLGDIAGFPFVDAPDSRAVRDGLTVLTELGALADGSTAAAPRLTDVGRELARMPVDPRLARMLVQARRNGSLAEALVVVSALSIQDVRERPAEERDKADALHARFVDPLSDFSSHLRLWVYLHKKRRELSGSAFRRLCRAEYLHWLRIREWQDLYGQLRAICRELGWETPGQYAVTDPGSNETAMHQALLSGLLSHIGLRSDEGREFHGARGTRFLVFPGSALAKKPPRWIMAAELVETSRLFARTVARIEPEWVDKLAAHLVVRQHSEPHWSRRRGAAMVIEKVTLYGLPVVTERRIPLSRVDVPLARELFIRHALVDGDWGTRHAFFHENRERLEQARDTEEKARRRDLVVDDAALMAFYERRIPAHVVSARHFDDWWKKARRAEPRLLDLDPSSLLTSPDAAGGSDYPDMWVQGETRLPLTYRFEPGRPGDGVTVRIPLGLLEQVRPDGFDWSVPGFREELFEELIRTLPKELRRRVVPAPDYARRALGEATPRSAPVTTELARCLTRLCGSPIRGTDMDLGAVPAHLRMTFAAVGEDGGIVDTDRSLTRLRARLRSAVDDAVEKAAADIERPPATRWTAETFGDLPESVTLQVDGQSVTAFPALSRAAAGTYVVRTFPTEGAARAAHFQATLALLLDETPKPAKNLANGLTSAQVLALGQYPHGGRAGFLEDCRVCAVRDLLVTGGGPVRTATGFARLRDAITSAAAGATRRLVVAAAPALEIRAIIAARLADHTGPAVDDMQAQLSRLLGPGFVTRTGAERLRHLPRYLRAMVRRIEVWETDPRRDDAPARAVRQAEQLVEARLAALPAGRRASPAATDLRWLLEEFRVAQFAQALGTARPASLARIEKAAAALR